MYCLMIVGRLVRRVARIDVRFGRFRFNRSLRVVLDGNSFRLDRMMHCGRRNLRTGNLLEAIEQKKKYILELEKVVATLESKGATSCCFG